MSKKRKTKTAFNIFPDWNYEQEQKDLDRRSAEGWHLIKPGQHFHKYEQDTTKCYRYQMDYQSIEPEMERYKEVYAEQGWEYLESSCGWHYFRKLYDPMLPENAYEIYTDEESIAALRKRWAHSSLIGTLSFSLAFIIGGVSFFWFPSWETLIPLLLLGTVFLYCIYSAVMIRHPEKQKSPKASFYITLFYALFITLGIFAFLGIKSAHIQTNYGHIHTVDTPIAAGMENAVELERFDIYLSDNYLMDFFIIADAPICFTLRNEQGDIVFTKTDSNCHFPKHRISLKRGTYTAYFSDFNGSNAQVYYQLK